MTLRQIEGNSEWLNRIKEKAMDNGIPLDRMLRMDAEWVLFNQ
jgi:predicted DNA binding CopG/RHH family protein